MTLNEWVEDFKTVASQFKWGVDRKIAYTNEAICLCDNIRGVAKNGLGFCGCPLTCYLYAKTQEVLPDCSYRLVGEKISLSKGDCDKIATSADYESPPNETGETAGLRQTLLEIVGLTEK